MKGHLRGCYMLNLLSLSALAMQLKLNMSAQAAMKQIDLKDYASKFALSGLPVVKVGINFDPERRTIGDWKF